MAYVDLLGQTPGGRMFGKDMLYGAGIGFGSKVAERFIAPMVARLSPTVAGYTAILAGLATSAFFYRKPETRSVGVAGALFTIATNFSDIMNMVMGNVGLGTSYALTELGSTYDVEALSNLGNIELLSQGDEAMLPELLETAPMAANYGSTLV